MKVIDLALELQCRSKAVLSALLELGITHVVTDSQPLAPEEISKVRRHFNQLRETGSRRLGLAKSIAARFGEEI